MSKNEDTLVNWLALAHTEHTFSSLIGVDNYKSFQYGMAYATKLLELRYLEDEKFITLFQLCAFRLIKHHVIIGGLSNYARKANENSADLVRMGIMGTEASRGTQGKPKIKYVPPVTISVKSYQDRFEDLAFDIFNGRKEFPDGKTFDAEKGEYTSPIIMVAVQAYVQILTVARQFQNKRRIVIKLKEMNKELENMVDPQLKGFRDKLQEYREQVQAFLPQANEADAIITKRTDKTKGKNAFYRKVIQEHEDLQGVIYNVIGEYSEIEKKSNTIQNKRFKKVFKKITKQFISNLQEIADEFVSEEKEDSKEE